MYIFLIIFGLMMLGTSLLSKKNIFIKRIPFGELLVSIVLFYMVVLLNNESRKYRGLEYSEDKIKLETSVIEGLKSSVGFESSFFSGGDKIVFSAYKVEGRNRFPIILGEDVDFVISDKNKTNMITISVGSCIPGSESGNWLIDEKEKGECDKETLAKIKRKVVALNDSQMGLIK